MKGIKVIRIAAVGAAFCLTGAMILQMVIFTYRRRAPAAVSQTAASSGAAASVETSSGIQVSGAASSEAVSSGTPSSKTSFSGASVSGAALSGAVLPSLTDHFLAACSAEHSNNELSVYETEQVSFSGGDTIRLTAERKGSDYVSGMAESAQSYLYGEFSFTVTVPEGTGLFPAIWMLNTKGTALPEIDIYEHVGTEPDRYSGVLHYFSDKKRRAYFIYDFESGMPRQYTVGLSWHKGLLIWTLDGAEVFRTESHVPDEPMYLIMSLAVGGDWPGDPDEYTVFPACFTVKIEHLEPESAAPRQEG